MNVEGAPRECSVNNVCIFADHHGLATSTRMEEDCTRNRAQINLVTKEWSVILDARRKEDTQLDAASRGPYPVSLGYHKRREKEKNEQNRIKCCIHSAVI